MHFDLDVLSFPGHFGVGRRAVPNGMLNLGKKFLHVSRIRKIAVTRILARVFAYLPSFISQILDLIYWPVLIFILIYFELRDTENQQFEAVVFIAIKNYESVS